MKKSAFLIGLICLFFTSGFSQKAGQTKFDSSFLKSLNDTSTIYSGQTPQIKYFMFSDKSFHNFTNHAPELSDKWFGKGQFFGLPGDSRTFDNMPCFTPSGVYPMNIIRPDSSIRYMLLIKNL
ncbi:MAG: hypothetical protein ABSD71_13780 [Bacteroidales bacterium]|jgi:hypothetical protein